MTRMGDFMHLRMALKKYILCDRLFDAAINYSEYDCLMGKCLVARN